VWLGCLLGQHRLHWKLLAMGPIPRSMDQRLLLMPLAPTIFDAEQWWCQVPIAVTVQRTIDL
jgi:hypothetical protein